MHKAFFCSEFRCKLNHCLLAVALFLFSTSLSAQIQEQLLALDKSKTKDFVQFSQELEQLADRKSVMNKQELDYFRFLLIYQEIYLQGFAGVINKIEAMLAEDISETLKFRLSALAVNAYLITKDFKTAFSYTYKILQSIDDIDDAFTRRQVLAPLANLFIDIKQKAPATFYIAQLR
ncbi:MAG TPA: hypothetical protein VLA40_07085, partial [Rheinheimera sp.]|nr:hypothetical protein [Rheinheimera sp.]